MIRFRSRARIVAVAGAMCLAATLLPGCGKSSKTAAGDDAGGTYTIGVMTEMTGDYSFLGQATVEGAKVALAHVNAESGRKISIKTCDTHSTVSGGLACYDRLVNRDGVDALLGPGTTPIADAIAPKTDPSGDDIIDYVVAGGYGGHDMGGHSNQFAGHVVTEDVLTAVWKWAAAKDLKSSYMIQMNNGTGKQCANFLSDSQYASASKLVTMRGIAKMEPSAQSAAPQISKVPTDAGFLMLCVSGAPGLVAASGYGQSGLEMPAVLTHSSGVPAVAESLDGKVKDGTVYAPSFCPLAAASGELPKKYACYDKAHAFVEASRKAYPKVEPDVLEAAAFDGILQLAAAARATDGSTTAVRNWFESQHHFVGSFGVYDYSKTNHRGLGPDATIMAVERGGQWHVADLLDLPVNS